MADHPILTIDEVAAFERLKPRLARLWADVFPRDDEPYTSIVVPSVTLELDDPLRREGLHFYEEVLVFLLIRLRNPNARVVFVTSQPLPPALVDYYLQFLAGIPASHAAARLTLFSVFDSGPRSLTEKILERPRLLARIRAAVPDPQRAYLTGLRATALEQRLAVALDVPLNAAEPAQEAAFAYRSGARRTLREAGLPIPPGREGLRDETDVIDALLGLQAAEPGMRLAILKTETSFWDEGHALVEVPASASRDHLHAALRRLRLSVAGVGSEEYLARFARAGGVAEVFLDAAERRDASAQVRINPVGQVFATSTHDELAGGPWGLSSEGCRFPADDAYRLRLQEAALAVGRHLAARGLVSRISVEFLLLRDHPHDAWRLLAHSINLGVGGATHPMLGVRFLCGGGMDPATGTYRSPSGRPKHYRCTDKLQSPAYRRLLPDDVVELLTVERLNYSPHSERGALFYMLGGIAELGRVGMLAIGSSAAEADAVHRAAVALLDRESARSRSSS